MQFFQRLPPGLSIPLFYVWVTVGMVLRTLFGSAIGSLALALLAYKMSATLWGVEPMSFGDLVVWFSQQSEAYKVAALSSALTVAGFLVAFHTATINWRNQLKAELKSKAAGEVEEFFHFVTSSILDAEIYVNGLIDAVNKLQRGKNPEEAKFAVDYAIDGAQRFFATRNQISQAQVQAHRLKGRNYTILSSGWGLPGTLDQAIAALNEVAQRMWVYIPLVDKTKSDYIQTFHNSVNVEECKVFVAAASRFNGPMSGLAGGIKGHLLSPIMGFNWPMFFGLIAHRKEFSAAIRELHGVMNHR